VSAKSNLILIFLQIPELALIRKWSSKEKTSEYSFAKSNLTPNFLHNTEPADLSLGRDCLKLGTGWYYQISNTQRTSQKFHAWDDGWMDGWQFSHSEMVFKKETDGY
jgi:hypothetical protein